MMTEFAGLAATLAAGIFNQNWPEGIVGLIEIFCLCCVVGGVAAVVICRTRHSYHARHHNNNLKEVNSNRWADDRNKDAR